MPKDSLLILSKENRLTKDILREWIGGETVRMNSLQLLSAYSDGTGSDSDEDDLPESSLENDSKNTSGIPAKNDKYNSNSHDSDPKRKLPDASDETTCKISNKKRKIEDKMMKKLPSVPLSVHNMFTEKNQQSSDDPSLHDGRVRSFPHERGNWATYVFVRYPEDLESFLKDCLESCIEFLDDGWRFCDDFHLSLSQTVSLPHHCIMPIKDSLSSRFSNIPTFPLAISGVEVYVNDEKTRSFIGLIVSPASEQFVKDAVSEVDNVFSEYRLQKYYEEPSFHLSFAWKCGDVTDDKKFRLKMKNLRDFVAKIENEESYLFEFVVDKIFCKTGNKVFGFNLKNT